MRSIQREITSVLFVTNASRQTLFRLEAFATKKIFSGPSWLILRRDIRKSIIY